MELQGRLVCLFTEVKISITHAIHRKQVLFMIEQPLPMSMMNCGIHGIWDLKLKS